MAYKLISSRWNSTLGDVRNKFILDSEVDVAILPESATGSTAVVAQGGKAFMVNASGEWVDFGTATNIDVVDATGAFRGGAIMPGLLLSANALFSRAAKLSSVPLVVPPHALGDSTETAVQSGVQRKEDGDRILSILPTR